MLFLYIHFVCVLMFTYVADNVQSPQTEGNYNILATDYANYAVVYSCSIANFRGRETKFGKFFSKFPCKNNVYILI